ncbi:MAG TPA: hypothetical protein VIZ65_10835 [Cellvibrionaceae bacterium]
MNQVKCDLKALAPVAIYTYTRYNHLINTLEALRKNHLASQSVIYVVSDGAGQPAHEKSVKQIRDYVDNLTGFREIVRVYRESNYGLRRSIPEAENMIIADHGKVISMEDDNITSANYLDFINSGLQFFEDDETVYSICGYCPPLLSRVQGKAEGDFWRYPWNISWGYGIWKKKYDRFHPLQNRYSEMRKNRLLSRQNRAGGLYVSDSLKRDYIGRKYFPDAILCADMFEANMQAIIPTVSKVQNMGQDGSGQSTGQSTNKYDVVLDLGHQRDFDFTRESSCAELYRTEARGFFNGSRLTRWTRLMGVYHHLTELRERWKR